MGYDEVSLFRYKKPPVRIELTTPGLQGVWRPTEIAYRRQRPVAELELLELTPPVLEHLRYGGTLRIWLRLDIYSDIIVMSYFPNKQ